MFDMWMIYLMIYWQNFIIKLNISPTMSVLQITESFLCFSQYV